MMAAVTKTKTAAVPNKQSQTYFFHTRLKDLFSQIKLLFKPAVQMALM